MDKYLTFKRSLFKTRLRLLAISIIGVMWHFASGSAQAIWNIYVDSNENKDFVLCRVGYITAPRAMIEANNIDDSLNETPVRPRARLERRLGFWGWTIKQAMQMNDVSTETFNIVRLYIGLEEDNKQHPERLQKVHFIIPTEGLNDNTPRQSTAIDNSVVTIWGNRVQPPYDVWRGWGLIGTPVTIISLATGKSQEEVATSLLLKSIQWSRSHDDESTS